MKTVAIIQARLTSTRLPKKVLMRIGRKTMLQHVIDRVKDVQGVDEVVVASPHKIPFKRAKSFIGSEEDVLKRYYDCAKRFDADIIIRVTSDCPLLDPEILWYALHYFKKRGLPYVYFAPIDGFDVEVFSRDMLDLAHRKAQTKEDREHVTPYMQRYTKMSVDTKEELDFARCINGLER